MEKDTVIFDLDGTLLDTLDDLHGSTNAALSQMGYPLRTREEVRQFVGNGIAKLIERAVPTGTGEENIAKTLELFREHYGIHCNDRTKAYPGIMELIKQLKERGIRLAIVSNKADFAVKELNRIYFADSISVAIGEKESEGIRKKPAPDTVFAALKELGSEVNRAVYVGDSEVDIATAKNAGMDAVLCAWGFRGSEFLKKCGAKIIIEKPEELISLL